MGQRLGSGLLSALWGAASPSPAPGPSRGLALPPWPVHPEGSSRSAGTKRGPAAEMASFKGCPSTYSLQARSGTPAASLRHPSQDGAGQYVPGLERSDTAGEFQVPVAVKRRGMFLATTVVDVTKS